MVIMAIMNNKDRSEQSTQHSAIIIIIFLSVLSYILYLLLIIHFTFVIIFTSNTNNHIIDRCKKLFAIHVCMCNNNHNNNCKRNNDNNDTAHCIFSVFLLFMIDGPFNLHINVQLYSYHFLLNVKSNDCIFKGCCNVLLPIIETININANSNRNINNNHNAMIFTFPQTMLSSFNCIDV